MPTDSELFASIVAAAREAVEIVSPYKFEDLQQNRMLELSLTKLVENIGEAARLLPDEARAKAPHIPWRDIVAMRHRLVHDYENVTLRILWEVVTVDCVELLEAIEPLVEAADDE
jgi:uncharacterized protein with HEPN domain